VATGRPVAGLACEQGAALYVDAEMGPEMFANQRLRPAGITAPPFEYIDAMGLDVSLGHDLAWLRAQIEEVGARFVVVDSLRRLVPSKAENDSDDMAPTVAALAKLARDTSAGILLIHHRGDSEKFYRGSTAIKDQCDALFALLRDSDEDDNLVRQLRCRGGKGKMRYAPEPPDVFMMISPFDGGVVGCDRPSAPISSSSRSVVREEVKQAILAALREKPEKAKSDVAALLDRGRDDYTFKGAWSELERAKQIAQTGKPKLWRAVSPLKDGTATATKRGGVAEEEPPQPATTATKCGGLSPSLRTEPPQPQPQQTFACSCETPAEVAPDGRCSRCWGVP
jgi:hypothetical protein